LDSQQASQQFKQAEALYQQGQYEQALEILFQLNAQYPNSKNILYPMALSLENLGQIDKAEQLCERLVQLQHPNAERIKARLMAKKGTPASDEFAMPNLDGMDMGGLDLGGMDMGGDMGGMDLMGDLDAPRPKRAVPRPAPSSDLPKKIVTIAVGLIVVCGIAALGIVGSQKGWFKSNRETIETVEAKLVEFLDGLNSVSAMVDGAGEMSPAPNMKMKISVKGSFDCMQQEGKTLLRLEGSSGVNMQGMAMDSPFVVVCDGTSMFIEQTTMGVPMAFQQPMPAQIAAGNPWKSLLQGLHGAADLKLLKSEMLDGEDAYVIEAKPQVGKTPNLPVAGQKFGRAKLYIAKSFSGAKLVALDDADAEMGSIALKSIIANPTLSSSRFTYTPPSGVKVQTIEDMMKQTPGMSGMPGMPGMPGMK